MTKAFLALGVAAVALTAAPAEARHHNDMRYHNDMRHHGRMCAKWRHHHCVRWANHGYWRSTAMHQARWRTGYVFGPNYGYTAYNSLPQTYVRRYDLNPDYRYVYRDDRIYVVNPRTYAIERIIDAITR